MQTIAVLDFDSLSGKSRTKLRTTGSSMYLCTVALSSLMSESSFVKIDVPVEYLIIHPGNLTTALSRSITETNSQPSFR